MKAVAITVVMNDNRFIDPHGSDVLRKFSKKREELVWSVRSFLK